MQPEPPSVAPSSADASSPAALAPVAVAPPASATPAPTPTVTPDLSLAKAWTDSWVVSALAKDCRYEPEAESEDRPSPLSCKLEFEQSCVPDPCFEASAHACKPACAKACDGCGAKCVKGCESCKAACKDDTCTKACAEKCGACRQECLTTMDSCATGTCGKAYAACQKKVSAEWKQGGCAAACTRVVPCVDECFQLTAPGAAAKCNARCEKLMGTCPSKFFTNCAMGAHPSD